MSNCSNCSHLQAALRQAQDEIQRLRAEVAMLQRIIAAARGECVALANEAGQPMPEGVPRGTWTYTKGERAGKGAAARKVLSRLSM